MNKNNDKLKLKYSFFGYNLYSSSFISSPYHENYNLKNISIKNAPSSNPKANTAHKRYKSDSKKNNSNSNLSLSKINPNNSNINNTSNNNLKVMVRIRPPLPREIEFGIPFRSISEVSQDNKSIIIYEYLGSSTNELFRQHEFISNPSMFQEHHFSFDNIFDQDSTQLELYIKAGKPCINSLLEGYNSTIIAYGQTGTGKTYTMEGFTLIPFDDKRGIIPRVVEDIFSNINLNYKEKKIKFIIRASYLQIYNEYISDLLLPEKKNLLIREMKIELYQAQL